MSTSSHQQGGHVTDAELAAYLDRTVTASERDRIEDHLASCGECRLHMRETKGLLQRVARPRKLLVGASLAAAAGLVLLFVSPDRIRVSRDARMRGDVATGALPVYGPVGTASRAGLRFVWSSARGAQSYRLTVSRQSGESLWSSSGVDTLSSLPDSVKLRDSERYFWVVDAILGDGTTRSTGLREFGVTR